MSNDDKPKTKKPRSPEETLRAIEDQEAADELARIKSLTDDEVEAELREAGADLDAIDRRTLAQVKNIEAAQKRAAWQPGARERLEKAQGIISGPGPKKTRGLSRDELLARIEAASKDPRLSGRIAVAYRDKKLETRTDAELEAILDGIENLARLDDV